MPQAGICQGPSTSGVPLVPTLEDCSVTASFVLAAGCMRPCNKSTQSISACCAKVNLNTAVTSALVNKWVDNLCGNAGRKAAPGLVERAATEEEQGDSGSPHDSGGSSTPFPAPKAGPHGIQVHLARAVQLHAESVASLQRTSALVDGTFA